MKYLLIDSTEVHPQDICDSIEEVQKLIEDRAEVEAEIFNQYFEDNCQVYEVTKKITIHTGNYVVNTETL